MENYINIINFCIKNTNKFFTKETFSKKDIIVPNDIFYKKNMKREEILQVILNKFVKQDENFIINLCEKNPHISFILLQNCYSEHIINLFFSIISEELCSPLIICSDFRNINTLIQSIIYGKIYNFHYHILSPYLVVINLVKNFNYLNQQTKDIVFINAIKLFNSIYLSLISINKNNYPSNVHLYFPYHFISYFINEFNVCYWEKIINWLVKNNLWEILNNIDRSLQKKREFYFCILHSISFNKDIEFQFMAENTITLKITSCKSNIQIFNNIIQHYPNNKDVINRLTKFYEENEYDLKINGIQYYNELTIPL